MKPTRAEATTAYKIVEAAPDGSGAIRTLYHGVGGSRAIEPGVWLEADMREVRDGSGDRYYLSGWHTLPTYEAAQDYLGRFRSRTEALRIVEVEVAETWEKEHSPKPVILSRFIKFNEGGTA